MTVTEDAPAAVKEIGNARRRKEDQRLITGRTRWTDNIVLPGMLHMAMVRSPFAHATITNIDTTEAKAAPNVVAVLTGADLGEGQGVNINAWPITPDQKSRRTTCRCRPTESPSRARSSRWWSRAAPPRPATPRTSSTSTTRSCRPRSTSRRPPRRPSNGGALAHPDLGTNKSALWVFDSVGGRHRRQRRGGHREGPQRRRRRSSGSSASSG